MYLCVVHLSNAATAVKPGCKQQCLSPDSRITYGCTQALHIARPMAQTAAAAQPKVICSMFTFLHYRVTSLLHYRVTSLKLRVVSVAVANKHTVILTDSGAVYSWGANDQGQLGYGTSDSASNALPRQVEAMKVLHFPPGCSVSGMLLCCICLVACAATYVPPQPLPCQSVRLHGISAAH